MEGEEGEESSGWRGGGDGVSGDTSQHSMLTSRSLTIPFSPAVVKIGRLPKQPPVIRSERKLYVLFGHRLTAQQRRTLGGAPIFFVCGGETSSKWMERGVIHTSQGDGKHSPSRSQPDNDRKMGQNSFKKL